MVLLFIGCKNPGPVYVNWTSCSLHMVSGSEYFGSSAKLRDRIQELKIEEKNHEK